MKDFTAKEQIFLLDIMIGNVWLFLDRTSRFRLDAIAFQTLGGFLSLSIIHFNLNSRLVALIALENQKKI